MRPNTRPRVSLVALSNDSMTGSRAELVLEMRARQTRFLEPPSLLDTLETTAIPKRHRNRIEKRDLSPRTSGL